MRAEIRVLPGAEQVAHAVVETVGEAIATACRERRWCYLALPGGPFVRPIYAELRFRQLPWSEVEFYFTDERCVPPKHPASNFGEAADQFLRNPRIGEHQLHRIEAEQPDREWVAERYEEELPDEFDCVLLEMGSDGHVGALFPGSPALTEAERHVVPVEAPSKPKWRIALTPLALRKTRHLVVVATGGDKAAPLQRVFAGDEALPAALAREAIWIVDREAAAALHAP